MFASVIICTIRGFSAVRPLLHCLAAQEDKRFEVLLVDGGGPGSALASSVEEAGIPIDLRLISSRRGLAHQRNVGLAHSRGDVICFLDDDVVIDPSFLSRAKAIFARPELSDVGGVCGYDVLHFPQPVNLRWRLRKLLRTVPSLNPGEIDRLGRSIPIGFTQPFSGFRTVGYFYGFCMVYRTALIDGMRFDESLPTYGGEDRDFSFRVGLRCRLLLCGDLHVEHRCAPEARDGSVQRTYQAGFGTGRGFAKFATRSLDRLELGKVIICEFVIDFLSFLCSPSRDRFAMPFARIAGCLAGFRSLRPDGSREVFKRSEA